MVLFQVSFDGSSFNQDIEVTLKRYAIRSHLLHFCDPNNCQLHVLLYECAELLVSTSRNRFLVAWSGWQLIDILAFYCICGLMGETATRVRRQGLTLTLKNKIKNK